MEITTSNPIPPSIKPVPRLLVDAAQIRLQLVEGSESGKVVVRGEFAKCGVATENKRVYPTSLWEREIGRLKKAMTERRLLGELDHPCLLSDDFRVLTEAGWKSFRDVKIGDKVWSRVDGRAQLSTVEGVVDEAYEGPAYTVKGSAIDSGFTPNHRFLLTSRTDAKNPGAESYVTLDELAHCRADYGHHNIPKVARWELAPPELNIREGEHVAHRENISVCSLDIKEIQHSGNIFCLTVTYGNFYMEQNGKSFWTGNSDGKTQLSRASHIITRLEIKDGVVIGEAEILDTAKGRDLKAILAASGVCGVSSRGYGSVRSNEKGEDVVQPDYRLVTWDFVSDPADQDALPVAFNEDNNFMSRDTMERDQEDAKKFAAAIEAAKKDTKETVEVSLRDEFAKDMVAKIAEARNQVIEQVRGELLSDPTVAGAKTAIDKIKAVLGPLVLPEDVKVVTEQKDAEIAVLKNQIAEQTLKIKDLEGDLGKLEHAAKEAGYKFFIERTIGSDPDADLIRKLIGDVTRFENSEDLKAQIESIQADLAIKRAESDKLAEQIEARELAEIERKEKERVRALKQEKALREERDELKRALGKALQAAEQLQVTNYAESRLRNHPNAEQIRPLIESVSSQKEVDKIISKFRETPRQPDQVESVRARIRKATQGGVSPNAIEEEAPAQRRSESGIYGQLGVSLQELRSMAGMEHGPTLSKK